MKILLLIAVLTACNSLQRYVCKPSAAAKWMSHCRNNFEEWVCLNKPDGSYDPKQCTPRTPIR